MGPASDEVYRESRPRGGGRLRSAGDVSILQHSSVGLP